MRRVRCYARSVFMFPFYRAKRLTRRCATAMRHSDHRLQSSTHGSNDRAPAAPVMVRARLWRTEEGGAWLAKQ